MIIIYSISKICLCSFLNYNYLTITLRESTHKTVRPKGPLRKSVNLQGHVLDGLPLFTQWEPFSPPEIMTLRCLSWLNELSYDSQETETLTTGMNNLQTSISPRNSLQRSDVSRLKWNTNIWLQLDWKPSSKWSGKGFTKIIFCKNNLPVKRVSGEGRIVGVVYCWVWPSRCTCCKIFF